MSEELEEYPREPLDTDTIFAKFTRVTLSDFEVCALSLASMVSNPSVPASEIYLTHVSQCDCYVEEIRQFCLGLAHAMSDAKLSRRNGRSMPYMPSYSESWGRHAVADAMTIAFLGKEHASKVEGEEGKAALLGVSRPTYNKLRNFLAGVLTITITDFRSTLEWAMDKRKDTELQSRWGRITGKPFSPNLVSDIMGRESNKGLSEGCFRSEPMSESDSSWKNNRMIVHVGFNEDELWKPS